MKDFMELRGSHKDCNYLAEPGKICTKCGKVLEHDLKSLKAKEIK